jgi:hypothetical protein
MNRESIGCDIKFVEQQNTINNMFKSFFIIATNVLAMKRGAERHDL